MLKKTLFIVAAVCVIVGVSYLAVLYLNGPNGADTPAPPDRPGQQAPDSDSDNSGAEPDPILMHIYALSLEQKVV